MPAPRVSISWEENKRQVVLIGVDMQCPRSESRGWIVEASVAPSLQPRGLRLSKRHADFLCPSFQRWPKFSAIGCDTPHPIFCSLLCPQ